MLTGIASRSLFSHTFSPQSYDIFFIYAIPLLFISAAFQISLFIAQTWRIVHYALRIVNCAVYLSG